MTVVNKFTLWLLERNAPDRDGRPGFGLGIAMRLLAAFPPAEPLNMGEVVPRRAKRKKITNKIRLDARNRIGLVRDMLAAHSPEIERMNRAVERLSGVEAVLGQGQGGIARDTDYARRVASDLRLLLSERAELLATVERMRGALGAFITYVENDATEGVSIMLDYDTAVTKARAALTTGEATTPNAGERGSPIGQNDKPGLAFSAPERGK